MKGTGQARPFCVIRSQQSPSLSGPARDRHARKQPNWHPLLVHLPIALLLTAAGRCAVHAGHASQGLFEEVVQVFARGALTHLVLKRLHDVQASKVRLPTEACHLFRCEAVQRSDLMPAIW